MKVAASVAIAAAALGVSAHPSGHAHMHKGRDFVVANKPVTTTVYAVEAAAATSTSSTAESTPSSSSSSSSSSSYVDFCSGSSNSKKRATTAEIAYTGNTGTTDDYGCNIMEVDESIADLYTYTITFNNAVSKDQACVCFNKIGPKGLIDGFWKGNEALSFTLPADGTKVVAVDSNSQGGCACSVGSEVATTLLGEWASTWLEFDFGNTSNDGWSGADASCLVSSRTNSDNGNTDLHIPALKVCTKSGSETCSTILTGGEGTNAYTFGTEAEDGIGLNLNTDTVALVLTVGN